MTRTPLAFGTKRHSYSPGGLGPLSASEGSRREGRCVGPMVGLGEGGTRADLGVAGQTGLCPGKSWATHLLSRWGSLSKGQPVSQATIRAEQGTDSAAQSLGFASQRASISPPVNGNQPHRTLGKTARDDGLCSLQKMRASCS